MPIVPHIRASFRPFSHKRHERGEKVTGENDQANTWVFVVYRMSSA